MSNISDIFDLCLPTSYEVRRSRSAHEDSSAGWSGARAKYARSARIYSVVWETMTAAQSDDIKRHWNAVGAEVRTFEMHFTGDTGPVTVRFESPPQFVELGPNLVRVTCDFKEVL